MVRTVLVVDDDLRLLDAYKTTIERTRGMRAITATTGEAARLRAREHRPDVCIVDLQLGCESGLDLIASLRTEHPDARLLLVSGYNSTETTVAAMRAGAFDVLSKPVTAAELMTRVIGGSLEMGTRATPGTPSMDRCVWEHAQRVLNDCGGNRSEAARRLKIDRGTLQRWLDRPAPG